MSDPRDKKLADLLVNYSIGVKPNQKVLISGGIAAMPLIRETVRSVLEAGGHPLTIYRDDGVGEIFLKTANDEQLTYEDPIMQHIMETVDATIGIRASTNTRGMNGIDPARMQTYAKAMSKMSRTRLERAARGELEWVGTIYPTHAYAQDADMSLTEYQDFYYGACMVETADPVAEWTKFRDRQQTLIDWLQTKDQVRVQGENIDLTLSIKGRTWLNGDGKRNMPCGEIFTAPVEDSVNGWVKYTFPAIHAGREVDGIEMQFEEGRVTKASAKKNNDYLLKVLDTDDGARTLGEFAIGTNPGVQQFTRSILFDEKIKGTIHMAVGMAYPESGGVNKSSVHWDMICDMRKDAEISADGELFYKNGEFVI